MRAPRFAFGLLALAAMGRFETVLAATQEDPNAALTPAQVEQKACWAELDQPKYQSLRSKVLISPLQDSATISAPSAFPTPEEAIQLRALRKLAIKCWFPFAVKLAIIPGLESSKPAMPLVTAAMARIGSLEMLASGEITYLQYAYIQETASADANALYQETLSRTAKQNAKPQSSALIALVCTLNPTGGGVAGSGSLEIQYSFDPVALTGSATRGSAPPSQVAITPTTITFNQGLNLTSISRVTGHIDVSANNVGLLFTGVCQPMGQAKF